MNKTRFLLPMLSILLMSIPTFANDNTSGNPEIETLAKALANYELESMAVGVKEWTNQEMIEMLAKQGVTDESVSGLYEYFKEIVVTPPDPRNYTEYSIENGEAALMQTKLFGRTLHNLLLSLKEKDFEKYGKLIGLMRDILYLDSLHIPLAIKHDNSRDVYWYTVHTEWVKAADEEYLRLSE